MMTWSLKPLRKLSALPFLLVPLAALSFVACDDDEDDYNPASAGKGGTGSTRPTGGSDGSGDAGASGASDGGSSSDSGGSGSGGDGAGAGGVGGDGFGGAGGDGFGGEGGDGFGGEGGDGFGGAAAYEGPSVGKAVTFAALAYSAISTANISEIGGELGVSAAAVSTITGFDALSFKKYGVDSLAPNDQRTILAQQDVTALVGDINPRACDRDLTNVVGGLTGDITLRPGVTCMNSFSADVLVNGHVYLDAGGDPNAFFIIRGNLTLTVADGAEVVLRNGAQACGVFWRIAKEVTIGKTVKFFGTVISGTAITMKTGSTLTGRALAQTEGVQLDANTVRIPAACTHVQ